MNDVRRDTHDPVKLEFDWDEPTTTKSGQVIFRVHVERFGQTSAPTFELNLFRLTPAELEQLQIFLARRHDDLTTHYEIAWAMSWLVGLWLQQTEPQLSPAERHRKVRQLLLADTPSETPELLARGPGVRNLH